LFNPPIGDYIMAAYGILANIPFIIIQRYNRIRLVKVLEKIERKEMYKRIQKAERITLQ
jgi:glycosyl-4,4'-diaponeurosporenoate acyltransferase